MPEATTKSPTPDAPTQDHPLVAAIRAAKDGGRSLRSLAADAGGDVAQLSRLLGGQLQPAKISAGFLLGLAGALGRDVSELMGAGSGALLLLDPAQIEPNPDNPRKTFRDESLDELAASIAARGLLQPLLVAPTGRDGVWRLVDGERRWRALRRLIDGGEWTPGRKVRALVDEGDDTGDDGAGHLVAALIANSQREDVPPMEEARAIARLHEKDPEKYSTAAIAQTIGKTVRHVQLRLNLVGRLDPAVQAALEAGEIELAQARALTAVEPERQVGALPNVKEGWGAWATADGIRRMLLGDRPPVSWAVFPLERYDGEIIEPEPESPDAPRLFADVGRFQTLQQAAIAEKVAKLEREWAFVEVFRADEGEHFREWEWEKSKDRTVAGAAVVVGRDLRGVDITRGILPKKATAAHSAAGKAAAPPKPDWPKRHLLAAARHKTGVLIGAIAGDHRTALAIATLGLLGGMEPKIRTDTVEPDLAGRHPAVAETLARLGVRLRHIGEEERDRPMVHMPIEVEPAARWDSPSQAELLEDLLALSHEEAEMLFDHLVATRFAATASIHQPEPGCSALALRVADTLGIDMADHFAITADYLETLDKRGLLEVVDDLGVGTWIGNSYEKAPAKMTGKLLREALLGAATHPDNAGRVAGYVPREMLIAAKDEIEKRKGRPYRSVLRQAGEPEYLSPDRHGRTVPDPEGDAAPAPGADDDPDGVLNIPPMFRRTEEAAAE